MKAYIKPQRMQGSLRVPPSKSHTQRVCACALLSQGTSYIENAGKSNDEKVAYKLIEDLGAQISLHRSPAPIIQHTISLCCILLQTSLLVNRQTI